MTDDVNNTVNDLDVDDLDAVLDWVKAESGELSPEDRWFVAYQLIQAWKWVAEPQGRER